MSVSLKAFTALIFRLSLLKSFVSKGFELYKKNNYKKQVVLGFTQLVHNLHNRPECNEIISPFVK